MISILLTLAVLGFCAWLLDTYVVKSEPFRSVFRAVAAILLVLYLLQAFGVWTGGPRLVSLIV